MKQKLPVLVLQLQLEYLFDGSKPRFSVRICMYSIQYCIPYHLLLMASSWLHVFAGLDSTYAVCCSLFHDEQISKQGGVERENHML